jgi:hypothetical protein
MAFFIRALALKNKEESEINQTLLPLFVMHV